MTLFSNVTSQNYKITYIRNKWLKCLNLAIDPSFSKSQTDAYMHSFPKVFMSSKILASKYVNKQCDVFFTSDDVTFSDILKTSWSDF